jgi:hypothetical protein
MIDVIAFEATVCDEGVRVTFDAKTLSCVIHHILMPALCPHPFDWFTAAAFLRTPDNQLNQNPS